MSKAPGPTPLLGSHGLRRVGTVRPRVRVGVGGMWHGGGLPLLSMQVCTYLGSSDLPACLWLWVPSRAGGDKQQDRWQLSQRGAQPWSPHSESSLRLAACPLGDPSPLRGLSELGRGTLPLTGAAVMSTGRECGGSETVANAKATSPGLKPGAWPPGAREGPSCWAWQLVAGTQAPTLQPRRGASTLLVTICVVLFPAATAPAWLPGALRRRPRTSPGSVGRSRPPPQPSSRDPSSKSRLFACSLTGRKREAAGGSSSGTIPVDLGVWGLGVGAGWGVGGL